VGHDTTAALEAIDRSAREGEDLQAFVRDVVERLRGALVLKAAPTAKLPEATHTEANELRKLVEGVSLDELLYTLRAFLEADALMRESPHPRVELEIAAVRATRRPVPEALEAVLRRVDEAEARLRQQVVAPAGTQGSLLAPAEAPRAPAPERRPTAPRAAESPPRSPAPAPAAAPTPTASADLAVAWERVVEEVMRKKPTVGAVLAQARPGPVQGGELTIVLTGNHFHREMLADSANRDILVQAVRRNIADADRVTVAAGGESAGGVTAHPAVQAALAEFQGEVVAVRPRLPEGEGQ
jgi:DNA polymerase III gamma/tau subunit